MLDINQGSEVHAREFMSPGFVRLLMRCWCLLRVSAEGEEE